MQLPTFIQQNVSLKDKNWFQTGGVATFFAQPTTEDEFVESLAFAHMHRLPIFVLGQGANILISDEGFKGLVIHPQLKAVTHFPETKMHELVTVGAGYVLHDFIDYCLEKELSGLEEFSGIPGTIGGSVYINLHYFEFLLEQFLVSARVINIMSGTIKTVDNAWFNFGYDQSTLMRKEYFLLSATFRLKKVSNFGIAHARGRRIEIIRHRLNRYPTSHTCGSFFRNFHDNEVTLMSNNKKMIYVAYYLDKLGVKGHLKVGGAIVSYQHANMLVNQGNATSHDIISLALLMQEKVYHEFGIIPQPECQLVGFEEYPLMTQPLPKQSSETIELS
jgi:UDP-N-acetylmuramate dehydrogenase